MATLTPQIVTRTGLGPTYAACTGGGDAAACGADNFLHVKNTSGAPITVTLAIPAGVSSVPQVVYTSSVVSIPATTGDRMIGPLLAQIYQDPTTGLCTITYSGVTNLTIALIVVQEP